jgi:serine/threonine protein kinase
VTLVEDPKTHKSIALKPIRLKEASAVQSFTDFISKVSQLIQLAHPCLVEIVGCSLPVWDDPAIIGTKYVTNGSLRDVIDGMRSGTPPAFMDNTRIAIIVCRVILGRQFIHSRDSVHRDLKRANVVIDARGYPWIIDAGIARLLDFNIAGILCRDNRSTGTLQHPLPRPHAITPSTILFRRKLGN